MASIVLAGGAAAAFFRQKSATKSQLQKTTVENESQLQSVHRARIDAECELALMHADHEDALERLRESEARNAALEATMKEMEEQREETASKVRAEKEQTTKLRFSLTVANGRIDKMRKEIDALKAQVSEEGKLSEENKRWKERANDASKNLETTRGRVRELTEKNGELVKEKSRLEHELEDAKAAEAKLETARARNVQLTDELDAKNQELAASTHALQDAEVNFRHSESQNVQLGIEVEELREQVVALRAQEIELQAELKEMLETLNMVTSNEHEGEFERDAEIERMMEKLSTPLSERQGSSMASGDMQDVSHRMAVLMARVEECKTPMGISKAIAELDELQVKLRDLQGDEDDDITPPDVNSPDAWPISPPSPVTTSKNISDDVNIGEITPQRSLNFGDTSPPPKGAAKDGMCAKCGIIPIADGYDGRCALCHAKKQQKLAASPLQRGLASFKDVFSPSKEKKEARSAKKSNKKKGNKKK